MPTIDNTKIYINNQPRLVVKTKKSNHGFWEVFIDHPDHPGTPVARHLLPDWFVQSTNHNISCCTGGCTYSRRIDL